MPWGVARIAKIASAAATALIISLGGSTHPAVFPRWDYTYATGRGSPEPFHEVRQGLLRVTRLHDRGRQEDSDGPEFDRARDVSPGPHARPAEDLHLGVRASDPLHGPGHDARLGLRDADGPADEFGRLDRHVGRGQGRHRLRFPDGVR